MPSVSKTSTFEGAPGLGPRPVGVAARRCLAAPLKAAARFVPWLGDDGRHLIPRTNGSDSLSTALSPVLDR
jgi:hypothetical protein